jgi:hypothetical protein
MESTKCSQDGCEYNLEDEVQFWKELGMIAGSQSVETIYQFWKELPKGYKEYLAGGFVEETEEGEINFKRPQDVLDEVADKSIEKADERFNSENFRERWGGEINGDYYCGDNGNRHFQENK